MIKTLIFAGLSCTILATSALALTADQDNFCNGLSKLSGIIAGARDRGMSSMDAFATLTDRGLNSKMSFMITEIVYEKLPYADPIKVAGFTYLACIDAIEN